MTDSESYGDSSDEGENDIIDSEVDGQRYTSSVRLSKNSERKRKEPKFVESWLEVKEFKEWLAKRRGTDGTVKPYCKICLLEINLTKTGIWRHMDSAKHQTKGSPSLSTLFKRKKSYGD